LLREGLPPRLHELFHRYADDLRRFLRGFLKNRADAEDCLQETFLNIWQQEARGNLREDARGYIFTTALNLARNKHRYEKARHRDRHVELSQNADDVCSRERETDFYWREGVRLVEAELRYLKSSTRMVFLLHYVEQMPLDEIATQLGISKRTAQREIVRALDHLNGALGAIFVDITKD